jgi:imidazolonepropionase-like amidohydrolase
MKTSFESTTAMLSIRVAARAGTRFSTRITAAAGVAAKQRFTHQALAVAAAAVMLPAIAEAQLGSHNPAPGERGVYAITNARIVPVSGAEIARGTVVIGADGRIEAVGASVQAPAGARVIDASGLTVYPGMMDIGSQMGLAEITQGANATVDNAEVGSFNPNAQAVFGINPHSAHIAVARVVGVTHVLSSPTGGLLSGQSALINLAGWTVPEMTVVPRAALVVNLPRAGFGGGGGFAAFLAAQQGGPSPDAERARERQVDSIRAIFRDAIAYANAVEAADRDRALPRPTRDVVLAALAPAARGQMPVILSAERAPEIRAALDFAREMNLRPIILGGRDAWQVTDLLRERNAPVIFTNVMNLPSREDDPYDVNFSAPAKLAAAGVRFAIATGDRGPHVRDLPYHAGMAAAFGLSKEDALRSVTLWPAQMIGVGDRFGSIEAGKVANLVVTDGDLLEARTNTRYLFIDGRPVPLGSRHEDLYELFRERTR